MSFPETLRREHPCLGQGTTILLAYRGSIAHGTYEPSSEPGSIDDKDAIGVAVPGLDHYIGQRQFGSRGTVEIVSDPWDIVVYEARKAIHPRGQALVQRRRPQADHVHGIDYTVHLG